MDEPPDATGGRPLTERSDRGAMAPHILFIDDDPLMGRLVGDLLKQEGFQVTVALNGKDGLARARLRPPDLILLDVMMPGMDGFAVCQALRQDPQLHTVPVVLLTAMESPKLNEQAFAVGADVCMTKPFPPDRLLNVVNLALHNATLQQQRTPKKVNPRD